MNFATQLNLFSKVCATPNEVPYLSQFETLLKSAPKCFDRAYFPGHFTGSAVITTQDFNQVLLTHHRKLEKWLQLGGHADGDCNLYEVAYREGCEESGLPSLTAGSDFESNLIDIDIHRIPERPNEVEHFHYDARYLFTTPSSQAIVISEESFDLRWFAIDRAIEFVAEESLRRLLRKVRCLRDKKPSKIRSC